MTFFVVADCTGHGVPGAFLSMIGIKMLSSIINERKEYDPKVILEMLNIGIQEALQQEKMGSDDGMDVCLCRIEYIHEGEVKIIFSGARRPLYYSSNQKIHILPGDRKTVGGRFFKKQVFTNKELHLVPGDRIYLCSDGIADQNAPNRQKFGSRRLVKLLEKTLVHSMTEQKEVLKIALDDFQENEKQRDDISLMAIKL
jgi:serine phosphatase RsbU (regulator of sigma subunit)